MAHQADEQTAAIEKLRHEVLQWHTHPGMGVERTSDDVDQVRALEVSGLLEDYLMGEKSIPEVLDAASQVTDYPLTDFLARHADILNLDGS